jgi:hypothetical protein
MFTLRTLAIVITGAGVFAALPVTGAQACDDDRYPCPIRVPQEIADAPAQAAPAAQPQKKVSHPARAKPQAKREQEAPRTAARAKPSKPAVQEQAAEPTSQKGADAAPAIEPPRTDQSAVATAGTAWPALVAPVGAGAPAATNADAGDAAQTNAVTAAATDAPTSAVQVVDKDEVNDLDRAAAASGPAESSWLSYLLLLLGIALAAAAAFWFVFRTASRFGRRSAHPRMHMSRS